MPLLVASASIDSWVSVGVVAARTRQRGPTRTHIQGMADKFLLEFGCELHCVPLFTGAVAAALTAAPLWLLLHSPPLYAYALLLWSAAVVRQRKAFPSMFDRRDFLLHC